MVPPSLSAEWQPVSAYVYANGHAMQPMVYTIAESTQDVDDERLFEIYESACDCLNRSRHSVLLDEAEGGERLRVERKPSVARSAVKKMANLLRLPELRRDRGGGSSISSCPVSPTSTSNSPNVSQRHLRSGEQSEFVGVDPQHFQHRRQYAVGRGGEERLRKKLCETRSVSPPPTSSSSAFNNSVNQMRTERLANVLSAMNDDKKARSQSFRLPARYSSKTANGNSRTYSVRVRKPVEGGQRLSPRPFERVRPEPDDSYQEFRRRTSSVPSKDCCSPRLNRARPTNGTGGRGWSPGQPPSPSATGYDPDSLYQRMRTFTIDANKAAVINRGDSFRRRCNTGVSPSNGQHQSQNGGSSRADSKTSSSISSRSHSPNNGASVEVLNSAGITAPHESIRRYHIVVLGLDGVGKTSMINQFMTSEYCNPFQNDTVYSNEENSVSVLLDGEESQLTFIEVDNKKNDLWPSLSAAGYLVVYSADDPLSFRNAKHVLFNLREQAHTAEKPVILVANKIDLERKRQVTTEDGKATAKENGCKFVEIAVALGHHVDELLVGILAQIRRAEQARNSCALQNGQSTPEEEEQVALQALIRSNSPAIIAHHQPSFRRSIRQKGSTKRSSFRMKKSDDGSATSCSNLTSVGHRLVEKMFGRREVSRSLEDLLALRN